MLALPEQIIIIGFNFKIFSFSGLSPIIFVYVYNYLDWITWFLFMHTIIFLLYFKHIYCQTNTDNGSDTSYKLTRSSPIIWTVPHYFLFIHTIIWIFSHYFLFIHTIIWIVSHYFVLIHTIIWIVSHYVFVYPYNYLDCLPLFFVYHTIIWIVSHYFLMLFDSGFFNAIWQCFFNAYLTVFFYAIWQFCGYRCQCFYLKTLTFTLKNPTTMFFQLKRTISVV